MNVGAFDKYGGVPDLDGLHACWKELQNYVAELRGRLDGNSPLLERYLHAMLESILEVGAAIDCAPSGFEDGMSGLFRTVRNLRQSENEDILQSAFYAEAKACDEQLQYEHDGAYRYKMVVALFHRYARHAVAEYRAACAQYFEDAKEKTGIKGKRAALAAVLGDEAVARLDDLLLRHQFSLSPERIYLQGLLDSLVASTLSAYEKTGEIPF